MLFFPANTGKEEGNVVSDVDNRNHCCVNSQHLLRGERLWSLVKFYAEIVKSL